MTLATEAASVTALGNGATFDFPYTFLIPTTDDVEVVLTDQTTLVETVLSAVQFSISGVGDDVGGLVTYPLSGGALTSGTAITIRRAIPLVQEGNMHNQGGFLPAAVENALDYLMMAVQQVNDRVARTFLAPFGASVGDLNDLLQQVIAGAVTEAELTALGNIVQGTIRCRAATTANITIATALNNGDTLDGVSLVTGDIVLVKNQSAPAQNGIYVVAASPARHSAFATFNPHSMALALVQEGSTNNNTSWLCTADAGGTLNTTAIPWQSYLPAGTANPGIARVRLGTTANIVIATALNVGDTIDGVVLADGDLVLVKNQSAPAENGIYVAGAVPARHTDFDAYNDFPGLIVVINEGTVGADSPLWQCTSNAGGTIGVTAITFVTRESLTNFTEMWSFLVAAPANGDYRFIANIPYACTINSVTTRSASGTCTFTGKINTTALGGTANAVSTSEQEQAHVTANVMAAGDDFVGTVSANAACVNMTVTVKVTRKLL